MLIRQPRIFSGLLLIFLLVACIPETTKDESALPTDNTVIAVDSSSDSQDQKSTEPPPAILTIDGREQTAGITSYCWQQGDGTGICADAVGVTTDPEPIPAGSTHLAEFALPLEAPPGLVQLSIFPASQLVSTGPDRSDWLYWKPVTGDQYTLPPNQNPLIELTLKPGPYVFNLFVDWPDHGEVSYGFLVNVGDALHQDAAAFAEDHQLPLDEAVQRLRFQETISEIQPLLEANLPEIYGGLWVEHQPEYRIMIGLTEGDVETIRPYLDGYEWADFVEVRRVNYTLEELGYFCISLQKCIFQKCRLSL